MHRHLSAAAARTVWRRVLSVPVAAGTVVALAAGGAQAAGTPAGHGAVQGVVPALAGTWRLLPRAPVTRLPGYLTAIWTGRQLIIHGIHIGAGSATGVTIAWRPTTRTWARLANGPRPAPVDSADFSVWTGSRMLVMGLTNGSYNPAANTWHAIARPEDSLYGAVTGWTGHLFLAWGGVPCCFHISRDGVAYNPATNTWRKLPTAPLSGRHGSSGAWTGRELVVAGGYTYRPALTPVLLRGAAAYNPATLTWRKIAPMPRREYGATAVWDGREVLFIGGTRAGLTGPPPRGLAYNPTTNRWRLLPPMAYPRTGFAAVWTGRRLLVWGGLTAGNTPPPHGEAYTPATNRWTALPASPLHGREFPAAVWTGRQMVIWGGTLPNGSKPPREFLDGAAFTPAGTQPTSPAGQAQPLTSTPGAVQPAAPVPATFRPASASFVSPAWGAALGGVACIPGQACRARLAVTADSGAHWRWMHAPYVWLRYNAPAGYPRVSQVVFAGRRTGWLYNQYGRRLWATHDAGAHWRRLSLPAGISALAASAGTAYALAGGRLYHSPAGTSHWTRAGAMTGSSLAVFGTSAWLGTSSHLWATSDGAHWHKYPFHCALGYDLEAIAAASTTRVFFLCAGNGAAGSIGKELMRSVNGGRTEQLAGHPPLAGSYPMRLAVPPYRPNVILVAASFLLYRTADGGKSWTTVIRYNGTGLWGYLAYLSPALGWAVDGATPVASQNRLLRTTDQGRTWHAVRF